MKLKVNNQSNTIQLRVPTTKDEIRTFELPTHNVHYWYPFNINYSYKYTEAKGFLYLVKEKDTVGEDHYKVEVLKRTKPLGELDGVMYHPRIHQRNMYIIQKAKELGVPTIKERYTSKDVQRGFEQISHMIDLVKERIEQRYLDNSETDWFVPEIPTEDWDKKTYSYITEEERKVLNEFGEMYTMLTVMRKIAEGR